MDNSQDVYEMQMWNQAKKMEENFNSEKKISKSRRKSIEMIAEKSCNFKYAKKQLGGPNLIFSMSDVELRDFIIQNITEQKEAYIKNIKELQTIYMQQSEEKNELAQRILELQSQLESQKTSPLTPPSHSANNLNEFSPTPLLQPIEVNLDSQEEVEKENTVIGTGGQVWDISQELAKLDIYQEEMLKVIGKYGYSETKDIYNQVIINMNNQVQETTLKNKLPLLIDLTILEVENVSTFLRKNLNLYGLTALGEEMFRHLTNTNPVIAQKNKLKTQHSSLKHAYSIKDTAQILEMLGYTNISMDSSKNQIQVAGGNRYVPDIIANFEDNKKTFWEVELAHHKDGDFFEKLQKAAKVTDTLYIIAPDRDAFDKLKRQIGRYKVHVMNKGLKTQITIFLATMNHLKKREIFTNSDCKIKI